MASSYLERKAKKQAEELEKKYGSSAYGGTTWLNNQLSGKKASSNDIAPVATTSTKKKEEEEERKWFDTSVFDDGYQFGDITKIILGTGEDLAKNVGAGLVSMGEKAVDAFVTVAPYMASGMYYANGGGYNPQTDAAFKQMTDSAKDLAADFVSRDLYDEQKVAEFIVDHSLMGQSNKALGIDSNTHSVFGEKADALAQSGGQLLGQLAANAIAPGSGMALMGVTAFGSEAEGALQNGATLDEAAFSGAVSAGAEILTEKLGGISFGGKTWTDAMFSKVSRNMTSKLAKILITTGKVSADALAEGAEEIMSGYMSAIGQKLSYMSDKEIEELFSKEDRMESFIGGFVLGGLGGGGDAVKSTIQGVDPVSGLNKNEKSVVDKEYNNRLEEREANGEKLTAREKSKLYDTVVKDMEKGIISTDTIEEVLGDRSSYDALSKEAEEYDTLYNTPSGQLSKAQQDRLTELDSKNKANPYKDALNVAKDQYSQSVFELVKGDRLAESYNERTRRGQAFEADLTQYDAKQQAVIQKAIDSGILNNTNRTHEFVDIIAKISADKGVSFDFLNNEKLKGTRFARDDAFVNGYYDSSTKTIGVNIDSAKAWQSTVGHEITHVLEGTGVYNELQNILFEYAKTKGKYDSRRADLSKLYDEKDIDTELAADLVGEYLFQDSDFIHRLSTENRNVFQKIYDEIKYLCKIVTAGSKEARELEKVKKAFEDAYRANGKANGRAQNEKGLDRKSEVQFSLSNDTAYMDKAIAMNDSSLRVDGNVMTDAKAIRERIAARMNDIKDRGLVGLPEDIEGNTYIANSSYDGTEENTTICPRSLASEAFVDAVSEYLGRPLSVEEQIFISQDLQGRSLTPECTYCYVATDRKAYRAFLGEYINQRDAVLQKVKDNPNADASRNGELYKEFLNGRKDTNPMYDRFKMWVNAYKNGTPMVEASHLANINRLMGDINSEFGAELKPQIVDAMKYAQSASWAKKRINYVAYNGHILKWKQDRINKLNSHYGLRMYSFSDFHPAFVLENMQMITDASVRGLKMLGYTKDTDFVEIFAPSGMNINVSTFGFETGGNVYENNIIGAEWEKAKALREQYPNVGVTFVATNDHLVNWALDQDWIDVVIPYHLVRTGAEVAKAFNYTNYTSESADTKTTDWVKGDKKSIAPTEHNNDKATYLSALEKNHLKPRFERFIGNPNYMKLVNECRQSASESKPVQPVFNENAAMVALAKLEANGYYQPIGGSVDRMYEIAAEVAEDMQSQIAPAMSLSEIGEQPRRYGSFYTPATELRYEAPVREEVAPVAETVSETESVAPEVIPEKETTAPITAEEMQELFSDDLAPAQTELDNLIQQREALESRMLEMGNTEDFTDFEQVNAEYISVTERIAELENEVAESEADRVASIGDADAPMEREPVRGYKAVTAENPFADRSETAVGNRSVKAYQYENPEVKPFFREAAYALAEDIDLSIPAERWYNDKVYYESGGEKGFGGNSRLTAKDVGDFKDQWNCSWDDLREAVNDIIEDNGKENHALAKRVEFLINDRLMHGYTNIRGERIEPNQAYLDFLKEKQINEYSKEAREAFFANADQYAPADIAPVAQAAAPTVKDVAPVKEAYEAIKPKSEKQPRLARATPAEQARAEANQKGFVKGQQVMEGFEQKTAYEPKTAQILVEEPKVEKKKSGAWSMFKDNFVDKGTIFETLSLKTGNRELQGRWKSIGRAESSAQWFMEHGNASTSSLKTIRDTVEKSGKTKEFYEYLYHLHNADRMNLEDRYVDVENKPVFGYDVTSEMSRKTAAKLETANPEFKQWSKEVYDYMTYLREMMVDNGVISAETAKLWAEMYPHYVPVRRKGDEGLNINVALDTRRTGVNAPAKKATGGNRDILPLFDTMAMRTEQTFKAVARNRFGVELKNMLGTTIENEAVDIDEAIDSVETELLQEGKDGKNPTFTVFENGEKVTFEITDEMYDTMKPKSKAMGYTNKVLNTANNIRRGLITEYNLAFMLTNPIKDTQDVLINSQHPARTYANYPKAIAELWGKKGQYYQEYMEHGGEMNTYFDGEAKTFVKEKSGLSKAIGFPLEKISQANNFIERIPRLAEYIASRQEGRSIDVSMLDAARVTTDFSAGGDLVKWMNRNGFTFLNASVQGAVQQVRNVREAKAEGLKGWAKLAAKVTAAGLPAMLLNHLLWDDDEEYDELSDYVKQNYYIVGKYGDGKFVRIPKGRTLAVIQDAFKQMENLVTGNDDVDLDAFAELVISNLAPSNPLENNLIAPIMQAMNNTTWYRDDLVPTRLQDLPAAEQFDETTDSISKWLGEKLDISPYKINYVLDQYSGAIGDMFLPMLTPEAERGNNTMIAPIMDKFTTDSVMKNQNVSDFYDKKDELTTNAKASGATAEDVLMNKYMNSINSELSALYAEKRSIQNSAMSDAEKYEAVRDIQKQIVDLTREGLATYDDIDYQTARDGEYANIGNRYFKLDEDGEWQKLSTEQATKYKVTSAAGDSNYASDGKNHYRWYVPGEDAGADAEAGWRKLTDKELEKQNKVTRSLGVSPEEYWNNKDEYSYAYENPGKYAVSKAVSSDFSGFTKLNSEINDIKDKNDSDSGTKDKDLVTDYIFGLDLDYGQKIILYRSMYSSKQDKAKYNRDIVKYLNSRDDISYEEMVSILKELDFTVHSNGTVTWD